MSTTTSPTAAALRAARACAYAADRASLAGCIPSVERIAVIIDAEIAPLVEALKAVLYEDDRATGNDYLVHRTIMDRVKDAVAKAIGDKP